METNFKPRYAKRKEKQTERRSFLRWLLGVLIVAVLLRCFVVETIYVEGPSMQPTLYTGERVLLDRISYRFVAPSRYDIIVCQFPHKEGIYVKRVIGLPGERVKIQQGSVYVNDVLLDDTAYANGLSPRDHDEILVPESSVYVLGDNRGNSTDSRDVGCVSYSMVRGRVFWVIWPFSAFGTP